MTSPSRPTRAHRLNFALGVIGEILITFGVVILLFVFWQLVWNDRSLASSQTSAAAAFSSQLGGSAQPAPTEPESFGEPVVLDAAPADGVAFGVLYVPRFGEGTQRQIATGVGTNVLNSNRLGVGYYPQTQLPGALGNFAVAGHRSAFGGPMHLIEELRVGDAIYVQTRDGWYTYRFRNFEYVQATAVQVLDPTPWQGATVTERFITLTSCNPLYSTAERIIAYGVMESWRPNSAGPPPEIIDEVENWKS